MIDFIIEKLTQLLIEQDFKEKQSGKITYVKKKQAYMDLINFLKKYEME